MTKRLARIGGLLAALLLTGCVLPPPLTATPPPVPTVPGGVQWLDGVVYTALQYQTPAQEPVVAHTVQIDLATFDGAFLVTPARPAGGYASSALTTSEYASLYGAEVALNGGDFVPWQPWNGTDYYPHSGDGVSPSGLTASQGDVYVADDGVHPTLFISATNHAQIGGTVESPYNALSGQAIILADGNVTSTDPTAREPRTLVCLSEDARLMWWLVIDGRRPDYSVGATVVEAAAIGRGLGADACLMLDGGGSSTLVHQTDIINRHVNALGGADRAVGSHLSLHLSPPTIPETLSPIPPLTSVPPTATPTPGIPTPTPIGSLQPLPTLPPTPTFAPTSTPLWPPLPNNVAWAEWTFMAETARSVTWWLDGAACQARTTMRIRQGAGVEHPQVDTLPAGQVWDTIGYGLWLVERKDYPPLSEQWLCAYDGNQCVALRHEGAGPYCDLVAGG